MLDFLPRALIIAVVVDALCQIFKFVAYSIKFRRITFKYLTTFGGMPSAHSAFVTSLSLAVGIYAGFSSNLFALGVVFSAIVIFDAYKLRGNVQKQAKLLNKLQEKVLSVQEQTKMEEMVGHTLPEILVGILLAALIAVPLAMLWR